MKERTGKQRASHVNTGTASPAARRHWGRRRGPVLAHPKLQVEADGPSEVTPYGGLAMATAMVKTLGLAREIDQALGGLLKLHLPYTESDQILAQAYNVFVGGTCIEDMANLQGSEAVRRMLGAARLPDPTTGGDFLRRFDADRLKSLDAAIDQGHERVWRKRAKQLGRKKLPLAVVDLDSHVRTVYGRQKEGADFSYKGTWAYHPLVVSLAGTNEVLRLVNRPGNSPSAAGAAELLDDLLPWLMRFFARVIVRGDSAFEDHEIFDACQRHGADFAIVMKSNTKAKAIADSLDDAEWSPFRPRADRAADARPARKQRKRRGNLRRQRALERKKRDLQLRGQWVASAPYKNSRSQHTYRLCIRRQLLLETDRQGDLFEKWRYRFVLTNITQETPSDVTDRTYGRCDQENLIEQLQNGVAGMRMPTGSLLANGAFLCCARLAHNLKSWLGQLVLPRETTRWEWKRFRMAYVYVAAAVVLHARQVHVRLARAHRFHDDIVRACRRLFM